MNISYLVGQKVKQFYKSLSMFPTAKNAQSVVVLTENTIDTLLTHFDYYKSIKFFNKKTWLKAENPRTAPISNRQLDKMFTLFTKLKMYDDLGRYENVTYAKRHACSKCSPYPVIDFESKTVGHCGVVFDCNKTVLDEKSMENIGRAETAPEYCAGCNSFRNIQDSVRFIVNRRHNRKI